MVIKKETLAQLLSCEFFEILTYFLQNTSGRLLLTGPYRSSGRAQIEWEELQKVLQIWKSVNRPLTYIGDEIFQQTLRPNKILRRDIQFQYQSMK